MDTKWLRYRETWIDFGTKVRPGTSRDSWRAWLTAERTKMLAALATGC